MLKINVGRGHGERQLGGEIDAETQAGLSGTWANSSCWKVDNGQEFQPPLSTSKHRCGRATAGGVQLEMTSNASVCGAEDDLSHSPEACGVIPEGAGQSRVPVGPGLRDTGRRLHSPALAAASTKVPSPRLWKRKFGPFSLSQKISEALLLRMGPTLTPRPPRRGHWPTVSGRTWLPLSPARSCTSDASEEPAVGEGGVLTFQRLP